MTGKDLRLPRWPAATARASPRPPPVHPPVLTAWKEQHRRPGGRHHELVADGARVLALQLLGVGWVGREGGGRGRAARAIGADADAGVAGGGWAVVF